MFRAIVVDKTEAGLSAQVRDVDMAALSEGDVTVRVDYSTINYKDGLAITGAAPILRNFPGIPGIDLAGVVETSDSPRFKAGDRVVLNGYGVGEGHSGGLAQKARVKSEWLVALPQAISTRQAMAIGTAGYTAMLSVLALEKHGVTPDKGPVLVTGASGGVGGVAIALLARLGYEVVASTGRMGEADYLKGLGAHEVIDRATLSEPGRPIGSERWAGAVDSVGSHTLANVCAGLKYGGAAAACGLAQGLDFPGSVAPFILRGVTLCGIDSVHRPMPDRVEAWDRLARDLDLSRLDAMTSEVSLAEALETAKAILPGQVRGRVVVDVNR
jgi:acrylyl-CoA reductase (NADPH)